MPTVLFVLGVVALTAKVNAYRPTRLRFLIDPSFFFCWIVIELAGWWLVLGVAAVAGLVAVGALHGWAGWAGLAMMGVSWAALGWLIVISGRTSATLRAAGAPPGGQVRFPRSQVIFPFLLTHRLGVRRLKDIAFAEVEGARLKLDMYIPNGAAADTPRPGILQLHGGDWSFGDKRAEGIPLLGHLAASGWAGINANYRLSPKVAFPVHLQDVKRAIAWYREHAAEFGADRSGLPLHYRRLGRRAAGHPCRPDAERCRVPARVRGCGHAPAGGRALVWGVRLH